MLMSNQLYTSGNTAILSEATNPIDATVSVRVLDNFLEASIEVTPPANGGAELSEAMIRAALEAKNVKYGIVENQIKALVAQPVYGASIDIAFGTEPIHGDDGRIVYHYDIHRTNRPKEHTDGTVNFWELDILLNVKKGDCLCTAIAATSGTSGTTVFGTPIPAKPGKPPILPVGKNVTYNEEKTELYAAIDGNLLYRNNQLHVDSVFQVNGDVDLSTGNIDFIGSVTVKGNIREGFSVKAKGDVNVLGMIEAANVSADGNIVVRGGIFGGNKGEVQCKGEIKCKYVENALIRCKGNITTEYMMNSNVMCEGEIILVGNRALMAGGSYVVLKKIQAKSIGTATGANTTIQLGSYGSVLEEKRHLIQKMEELEANETKLAQIVAYLSDAKTRIGSLPPDREKMLTDSIHTKTKLLIEKGITKKSLEDLENRIAYEGKQSLACQQILYRGTTITIKNATFTADRDYARKTFYYDEQKGAISMIDWA